MERQPAPAAAATAVVAAAAAAGDGFWRKGPWTPQEDKLLIEHVNLHGEGRWNSVSKLTGLRRSGKSCRLRWVNYLRPDLKRGKITPEEELIILELHALWGNRWSTIARSLPGRTDNEIKNYWRTHFKKSKPSRNLQRAQARFLKHQRKEQEEYHQKKKAAAAAAAAAGSAVNDEQQQQQEEGTQIVDDVITTTTMLSQLAEQAALEREIMAYMCVLQGTVVGGGRVTAEEEEEEEGGGGGGGWWGSLWNLEADDVMMRSMT